MWNLHQLGGLNTDPKPIGRTQHGAYSHWEDLCGTYTYWEDSTQNLHQLGGLVWNLHPVGGLSTEPTHIGRTSYGIYTSWEDSTAIGRTCVEPTATGRTQHRT